MPGAVNAGFVFDGDEVKVSLKIEPLPNETITSNNEMATYVNVSQEGLSVLLVDKERAWESQAIADALKNEPRIRLYTVWFRGAAPANVAQVDLFQFDIDCRSVRPAPSDHSSRLQRGSGRIGLGARDHEFPMHGGADGSPSAHVRLIVASLSHAYSTGTRCCAGDRGDHSGHHRLAYRIGHTRHARRAGRRNHARHRPGLRRFPIRIAGS